MEENKNGLSPRTIAIISHLTIIGWVFALIKHREDRSQLSAFYLRQTLGITLLGVAGTFIGNSFGSLGGPSSSIIGIAVFVFWIISLIGASNGEEKTVPLLGEYFQDWFKSL
ncbi:MAG TPA: hypothetical protein VJ953_02400 [Saprospiraceae bacterium]|nr:hypothetical protein [Saprospiraceae bacterium]